MSAPEPKSTAKRDALIAAERQYQERWRAAKLFETDAKPGKPKYFSTFPYPYMNGRLHLGHFFSFSKVEFASGFERLKGKNVLLPFGFHVTGMPIKACADKLKREVELFGQNFENYEAVSVAMAAEEEAHRLAEEAAKLAVSSANDGAPAKPAKKHSKALAKAGTQKWQWQIMESMGVERAEIHKFANPLHWLQYFPPFAVDDLNKMGCKIDWRRSFITTDANPYYDSFVRWQFNKLHALGKIKFGERHTIWSAKDGQPCMDHDRASGEGVGPQEYVGIKLRVLEAGSAAFAAALNAERVKGKTVSLVAATLRPETMYGQTNCFVGVDLEYGLWEINDSEVFVCTERAARNMAFQGFAKTKGEAVRVGTVAGSDLLGTAVRAPLAKYDKVYVLPLELVLANKGTGVVTSVPSDSPDDCAMTRDLKKKPDFYGIKPEWIAGYEPVEIIETPTYGKLSAVTVCDQLKISSPKDRVQLDKAKELVYKEGFYQGTIITGPYAGMSVQDAKPLIRQSMVDAGDAFVYSEPERDVISRSGDECVVNLCDQWYLDYGEPQWADQTRSVVDKLNTYHDETHNAFKQTLDWLNKWACARSFGLGTRLPWDEQFLIESLSDSTIYMAYYTVAHLLHSDLEGKHAGTLGVGPNDLGDAEWEYVFNEEADYPASSRVPQAKLDAMRTEFTYFYPIDLRSSGKDLVQNHLTMFLYNHACLFPEKHWPRSVRANGHVLFNSEKMSKSTGTFVTVADASERYGADATRLALADAGDGVEDANFVEATANAAILRLYTQREWVTETLASLDTLRTGEYSFLDRVFKSRIVSLARATEAQYSQMMYREALKLGFFEMQDARDVYREATALTGEGMHRDLVKLFIRTQALILSPITPHWSEWMWCEALKEHGSILNASWPEFAGEQVEEDVLAAFAHVQALIYSIRTTEAQVLKKRKGPAPTRKVCTVLIARTFPAWQEELLEVLKPVWAATKGDWQGKDLAALKEAGLLKNKKAMPFVNEIKKALAAIGDKAFNRTLAFDELATVQANLEYVTKSVHFTEVRVKTTDGELDADEAKKAENAVPGQPTLHMTFE